MTAAGCSRGSAPPATASGDDPGFQSFSFSADGVRSPTNTKSSQSRLWFNDGAWWGVLFDDSTERHYVYRYEWPGHAWIRTGTSVDERNRIGADVLWDGDHLYVVTVGPSSKRRDDSALLLRYSYDAATEAYYLDSDFPVSITSGGTESVVLAKDSTGKLWASFTQDGKLYASHSLGDDSRWAKPFVLPVQGTTVGPDDVSSVIAFDSQIGVMWSNGPDDAVYFATHKDGDAEDAWQANPVLQEPNAADDHVNLKADSRGRVFAAVKTEFDRTKNADPSTPVNLLLVRGEDGKWVRHVFGRKGDMHTKPMVLIDEEHGNLYMFATTPCCDGGSIYYKRTSLDEISFEEGKGTPFIQSGTDTHISDATSTKQNLNGETGLLVQAADKVSESYVHGAMDLDKDHGRRPR